MTDEDQTDAADADNQDTKDTDHVGVVYDKSGTARTGANMKGLEPVTEERSDDGG